MMIKEPYQSWGNGTKTMLIKLSTCFQDSSFIKCNNWAAARQNQQNCMCAQRWQISLRIFFYDESLNKITFPVAWRSWKFYSIYFKGLKLFKFRRFRFWATEDTKCHNCIFSIFLNVGLPLVFYTAQKALLRNKADAKWKKETCGLMNNWNRFWTRAGVYETLCPQHMLAPIDSVEHNVPYG